jgi:hypothetical protein
MKLKQAKPNLSPSNQTKLGWKARVLLAPAVRSNIWCPLGKRLMEVRWKVGEQASLGAMALEKSMARDFRGYTIGDFHFPSFISQDYPL